MTDLQKQKLSRRDAIKLLGAAAGATVLANLPSKWSKPELASGVLPAHAQTSETLQVYSLACGGNVFLGIDDSVSPLIRTSSVKISPSATNIFLTYIVYATAFSGTANLVLPNPNYGFVTTNGSGVASITFQVDLIPDGNANSSGFINIDWFFPGAAINSGCSQRFDWIFMIN